MRLHGVDLVLIQPFLLSYVNQAALMQLVFFKHNFHKKKQIKEVCLKTRSTSASHSIEG